MRNKETIGSIGSKLEFFSADFPSVVEIVRNVDIIFLATDEIIDFSAPTLPNIVNVGGLGVDDDITDMDPFFESEMQKGTHGVIFFSLGTIANTTKIDRKVMESFLEIVKKFPDYHFLIRADKYDRNTEEKARGIENVFVGDWFPQPAILRMSGRAQLHICFFFQITLVLSLLSLMLATMES